MENSDIERMTPHLQSLLLLLFSGLLLAGCGQSSMQAGKTEPARITDELGDVLFAVVNLARHLDIDAEVALRGTNAKFERRFKYIEKMLLRGGRSPEDSTLDEMDKLWREAKTTEG